MAWKSFLKPENSIVAGIAVMGAVYGVYQLNVGTTAQAAATDANHPVLESSRKKASYEAFALVAAIGLISRDPNIIILGSGTIIAMEMSYRHAIMAHPATGIMQPPGDTNYLPAENVVPMYAQGDASAYGG